MRPHVHSDGAIVRRLGVPAGDESTLMLLVHPGSLPLSAYGQLAAAIPARAAVVVADLERVPAYWEGALRGGAPSTNVDELVERVAHELPAWCPSRVVLAGWSFGGVIAHALGQRIDAERIVLLDSIAPVAAFADADQTLADGDVLRWFAMYLWARRGRRAPLEPDALAGVAAGEGLAIVLDAAIAGGVLRPGTTLVGLRKVYETYLSGLRRNQRLADAYIPSPAPAPVDLVKPHGSLFADSATLGWEQLAAGGLTVHRCGGDHYTMLADPDTVEVVRRLLATDVPSAGQPPVDAGAGGYR